MPSWKYVGPPSSLSMSRPMPLNCIVPVDEVRQLRQAHGRGCLSTPPSSLDARVFLCSRPLAAPTCFQNQSEGAYIINCHAHHMRTEYWQRPRLYCCGTLRAMMRSLCPYYMLLA